MDFESVEKEFLTYVEQGTENFLNFPWENREAYCWWLTQTAYFVRHTPAFLALSAARYGFKDPKNQHHSLVHLTEEKGHDALIYNDLSALGTSLDSYPELPETAAFYQSQYYLIEYEGAASHLGYALYLEGIASQAGPQAYERLSKAHGKNTATFLGVHVTEDPTHFLKGLKSLRHLKAEELFKVRANLHQTHKMYSYLLTESVKSSKNIFTKQSA